MNRDELAKSIIERGRELGKSEETIKKALEAALVDFDAQQAPQQTSQVSSKIDVNNLSPEERARLLGKPAPTQVDKTTKPKTGMVDYLTEEPAGFMQSLVQGVTKPVTKLGEATGDLLASGARQKELERGTQLQKSQDDIIIQKINEAKASGNMQEAQRLQGLLSQGIDYSKQAQEQEAELKQSRSNYLTGLIGTGMTILGGGLGGVAKKGALATIAGTGAKGAVYSIGRTGEDTFSEEGFKKAAKQAVFDGAVAAALAGIFYSLGEISQKKLSKKLSEKELKAIKEQKALIDKAKDPNFKPNINDELKLIRSEGADASFSEKMRAGMFVKGRQSPEIKAIAKQQPVVQLGKVMKTTDLQGKNYEDIIWNTENVKNEINNSVAKILKNKTGKIDISKQINEIMAEKANFARDGISEKTIINLFKEYGIGKATGKAVLSPSQAHGFATRIGEIASKLPKDSISAQPLFSLKAQISNSYMPLIKGANFTPKNINMEVLQKAAPRLADNIKTLDGENLNFLLRSLYSISDNMGRAAGKTGGVSASIPSWIPGGELLRSITSPANLAAGSVTTAAAKTAAGAPQVAKNILSSLRQMPIEGSEMAADAGQAISDMAQVGSQALQTTIPQVVAPATPLRFLIEQARK